MRKKLLSTASVILFALPCEPSLADDAGQENPMRLGRNLSELLNWVDQHHPELKATEAEASAASSRIDQAGALPDPTLRIELMDIDRNNPTLLPNRTGSTKYTFIQGLPWGFKRELQRDAARADARRAGAALELTRTELHSQLKQAYAEFVFANTSSLINNELSGIAAELEQIAQARYSTGLAPQQDAIKAQLEKSSLVAEKLAITGARQQAEAELNALLNRDPMAPLDQPVADVPLSRALPPLKELFSRADQHNPQLHLQSAQIEAASTNRELSQKNYYPDFSLGLAPIQTGSHFNTFEVMLEMNLPLRFGVRDAQRHEAIAMLSAAQSRRDAIAEALRGGIGKSYAGIQQANEQHQLIAHTMLPQAEMTYRSALAGYESAKVDFTTVLDAMRQVRQLRLELAKSDKERFMSQIDLERLLGEDL